MLPISTGTFLKLGLLNHKSCYEKYPILFHTKSSFHNQRLGSLAVPTKEKGYCHVTFTSQKKYAKIKILFSQTLWIDNSATAPYKTREHHSSEQRGPVDQE